MVAAQCAGVSMELVSPFLADSKGGTDIWEGLAWLHAKNLCTVFVGFEKKKPEGKDGIFFYITNAHTNQNKNSEE